MLNISGYPDIDKADYLNIKAGKDVVLPSGEVVSNLELTTAPKNL
jgi:ribonuclease Z